MSITFKLVDYPDTVYGWRLSRVSPNWAVPGFENLPTDVWPAPAATVVWPYHKSWTLSVRVQKKTDQGKEGATQWQKLNFSVETPKDNSTVLISLKGMSASPQTYTDTTIPLENITVQEPVTASKWLPFLIAGAVIGAIVMLRKKR